MYSTTTSSSGVLTISRDEWQGDANRSLIGKKNSNSKANLHGGPMVMCAQRGRQTAPPWIGHEYRYVPLLLRDHDGAADQRDPRADPTGAIPPAEIDLPGGGAAAAEA